MNKIRISCIIPTCDREDLLLKTVESVLNQTTLPDEIILVNNGKVNLNNLIKDNPLIKIFNIVKYAGVSKALNFGASIAIGDYLAFLEDDDLWEKNYIKNIKESIDKNIHVYVSRIDKLQNNKITKYKNAINKINLETLLKKNPGINISNLCIQKKIFIDINGFDPNITVGADRSLAINLLLANYKFKVLENNQEICRFHDNYRISRDYKKMISSHITFYNKYKKIMKFSHKINLLYKLIFITLFKRV